MPIYHRNPVQGQSLSFQSASLACVWTEGVQLSCSLTHRLGQQHKNPTVVYGLLVFLSTSEFTQSHKLLKGRFIRGDAGRRGRVRRLWYLSCSPFCPRWVWVVVFGFLSSPHPSPYAISFLGPAFVGHCAFEPEGTFLFLVFFFV